MRVDYVFSIESLLCILGGSCLITYCLFLSFGGLTKFLFSKLEKVSPTKYNEEENG